MKRVVVVVSASALTPQIIELLAQRGEWRGIEKLALYFNAQYSWVWELVHRLERAEVLEIDRTHRPYILRLSKLLRGEEET